MPSISPFVFAVSRYQLSLVETTSPLLNPHAPACCCKSRKRCRARKRFCSISSTSHLHIKKKSHYLHGLCEIQKDKQVLSSVNLTTCFKPFRRLLARQKKTPRKHHTFLAVHSFACSPNVSRLLIFATQALIGHAANMAVSYTP